MKDLHPPEPGPPRPPQPYPYPYPVQVAPKSTAAALLMSLFIPGLGSMYAGKAGWGTLILALYVVSWIMTVAIVGFITVPIVWIWGMAAAVSDARAWNRAHGIIS